MVNLNKHEHIEKLFIEARRIINSLDQLNQTNLMRSIEQYENRWKDLRERLNKKLEETSKILFDMKIISFRSYFLEIIRTKTINFIQECDLHLKKCIQFMTTLAEIQKDSTRTSKDKLEQLKVKSDEFLCLRCVDISIVFRLNIVKFLML